MSRDEINTGLQRGIFTQHNSFTVHAAYCIGDGRHITLFYNDRCNLATLGAVCQLLQQLPTGRVVRVINSTELFNPLNPSDPLIGVQLEIMTEDGEVDKNLMNHIADFSNNNSWRQHLAEKGDKQYDFKFHTTVGLKSTVNMQDLEKQFRSWKLVTGKKYFKIHQNDTKVYFE